MKFSYASSISHMIMKDGKKCDLYNVTLRLYGRSRGGNNYYLQGVYSPSKSKLERFVEKLEPKKPIDETQLKNFIVDARVRV